jgi:hypothetical protein
MAFSPYEPLPQLRPGKRYLLEPVSFYSSLLNYTSRDPGVSTEATIDAYVNGEPMVGSLQLKSSYPC